MTLNLFMKTRLKSSSRKFLRKVRANKETLDKRSLRLMTNTLQRNAPRLTGKFVRTIKAYKKTVNRSDGISYTRMAVGPTSHRTKFIINKTRASPGRYVKSMDKRITEGRHPGTAAIPFIDDSLKEIDTSIRKIYREQLKVKKILIENLFSTR